MKKTRKKYNRDFNIGGVRLMTDGVGLDISKAWGKATALARSTHIRMRPQMALLTGSILVLLSLCLPVGPVFDLFPGGPYFKGYEFVTGFWGDRGGGWPGVLSYICGSYEPSIYLAGIALSVLTIVFVPLSIRRPEFLQRRGLITSLFAIAVTLLLILLTDLFWLYLGLLMAIFVDEMLEGDAVTFGAMAALLVILFCLRYELL